MRQPSPKLIEIEQDCLVDFVTTAAMGLHWVAADGTILWANPADYEPLGYEAHEYIGHNITEFHAEPPVIEDILARLTRGDRLHEYEARLRCKDGSTRIVHITSSVLFNDKGEFVHTRCFTRDCTTEKTAVERLRVLSEASDLLASSLDFEATLSALARLCVPRLADWCAVDLLDEEGALRPVAAAHVDSRKTELLRELRQLSAEADTARGAAHVVRTGELEHEEDVSGERLTELSTSDDHERILQSLGVRSYIIVPIGLRGRVLGAIMFVTGDSGRRLGPADVDVARGLANRSAQAIENARLYTDAQVAMRRKDEFLAMLGHELRNPLAPIRTALEIMKLRGDHESAQERKIIDRQVRHLVRLVDDLLDVSRVTRGNVRLEKVPVEIETAVARAIEMTSSLLEQREHDLRVDVQPQGLAVLADPDRMAQVFANLLTNAAKYTEPKGKIRVRARREDVDVLVEVEDNGIGIPDDLLPNIFGLFIQSPQALDRSSGGLGIGLQLAQSLVTMHGGLITARSDGRGKGSRFTVRLPVLALAAAESESPAGQPARLRDGGSVRNVLVVDDNHDAAIMLAEVLKAAGHRVEVAHDGPSALALVEHFRPDIALLDIGLPVMDGYELAARIREKVGKRARLFAVTGYSLDQDRARSREAGFERHLVKPVALETLLDAVA
ncbi:hypothetical protein BH24PSE2_BH24PSE2_18580 [soil metagenome]